MSIRLRIYPQYGIGPSFGYGRRRRFGFANPASQALRSERQQNRIRLQYERALWSTRMQTAQLQASVGAGRYAQPYAAGYGYTAPYAAPFAAAYGYSNPYAALPYAGGMYASSIQTPYVSMGSYGMGGMGAYLGYSQYSQACRQQ